MPSMTEPTYQQLFELGKAEASFDRPDLSFRSADISEMVVAACAAMAAHVAAYAADRHRATTTEGEGDDLAALAEDHWSIVKVLASPAKASVSIQRTNGNGAPGGTLDAGTLVATARDATGRVVEYTLDTAQGWALVELGPKAVNVTCTATGKIGNVDVGKINRFSATPFDSTFTVTNPQPAAGGNPDQDDPSLRADIRAFPTAVREATGDALAFHLGRIPGVGDLLVVEEVIGGLPTGIVNVYLNDSTGAVNDALILAVLAELPKHRASGAIVNLVAGSFLTQTIDITLVLAAGLPAATVAALVADVIAAVVAGVNRLTKGQRLERAAIRGFAVSVDPDLIRSCIVNVPATDVEPNPPQSIRISPGDVAVH